MDTPETTIVRTPRATVNGFTLLELLVTLAVAAVLLGIAIPSYRSMVQRNAMTASVNDLVGDLQYARSEAVTRGTRVFVCKSANQSSCATSGGWDQGWIVYSPDPNTSSTAATSGNLLRTRGVLDAQVKITGNSGVQNSVFFDANGFALSSAGTFTATASTSARNTQVVVARTGRIRTDNEVSGS